MSQASGHDRDRQSDLAVLDANEYKQKRRLERILDAHDNVEDAAAEARGLFFEGEINRHALNIIVQEAVKRAIRENLNLLRDHVAETEGQSWYWHGDPEQPLGSIEREHSEDVGFTGLRDFRHSDWFYYDEWTTTEKPRNRPVQTIEHREELTVPRSVSWTAYERLKRFLRVEQDLEIQFEDMHGDKQPIIRDFDMSTASANGAEADAVQYNGDPDL